ncbi:MAG: chemotaxis protein CheX [Deltaproteobacteria bacterium]|nr:chemotaxis protein CheX [Deltaproteobacteria bacterium]
MLKTIRLNLTKVISEVLETMFFVFLEQLPVETLPQRGDYVGSKVVVRGPESGFELEMLAQESLLTKVAGDFLGLEEGAPTLEQRLDVLKEITNMVAGNLVNHCDPHADFDLGIPMLTGTALTTAEIEDCVDTFAYGDEDGVLLVGVRVIPGKAGASR